jgi:5-formyltetrahydrofolate cyclo-ligase
MLKEEIRKEFLHKRKQLGEGPYFEMSQQLSDQFFFYFHSKILLAKNIHLFLPIEKNKEPNTNFLLKILYQRFKKLQVVVPKTNFDTSTLEHHKVEEGTIYQENKLGIQEPVNEAIIAENEIDLVLVPLLAFDIIGNRIGYGGGYYDRFLAQTRPDCLKIGLSFFDPINELIEVENTDIKLDYCVTPQKVWAF